MRQTLFSSVLVLSILTGCAPNTADDTAVGQGRQDELAMIVHEWVDTRDDTLIEHIQNEDELHYVENLLQLEQGMIDPDGLGGERTPRDFAGCSDYWGTYKFAGKAETMWTNSHYSYYWSPNCAMAAPGDDCGTDHDDNMVSFWMGPDYSTTEASYRADSNSWSTYWNLNYHSGASYRVYTSGSYGNAYVCLSNSLDPSTLRFGRDY